MTQTLLQAYQQLTEWKDGDTLTKTEAVDKEIAHQNDLLHLSAHLIIIDNQNRVLSRKRKADDFRYADMWTSSIGTHVLLNNDYLSTLKELLPLQKELQFIGEFRIHDEWENEVNGLYIMRANEDELPAPFLSDKKFFTIEELTSVIEQNKTTPHLKGGVELLKQKAFFK
jgi:isopentenyldiphosphate isomerase